MRTLASEGIGAFIVVKVDISPLVRKSFPYGSLLERIWRDPFLIGIL